MSRVAEASPIPANDPLRPGLVASLIINHRRSHPQHLTLERKRYSSGVATVHYVVSLNEAEIAVINETYVDLDRYFYLAEPDQYVVVLTTASGGNACPSRFVLISFNENGLVHSTPPFGNCHEDPTFVANSERITINFPYGENPVDQTWTYEDGSLRQTR